MNKFTLTFILAVFLTAFGFSQADQKKEDKSLNREWKEAMAEVEETLDNIEIPDVDVDRIMDEVREAMPTKEELSSYKDVVREAVQEIKKIDLTELENALDELGRELEDIFRDHRPDKNKDKSKEK